MARSSASVSFFPSSALVVANRGAIHLPGIGFTEFALPRCVGQATTAVLSSCSRGKYLEYSWTGVARRSSALRYPGISPRWSKFRLLRRPGVPRPAKPIACRHFHASEHLHCFARYLSLALYFFQPYFIRDV